MIEGVYAVVVMRRLGYSPWSFQLLGILGAITVFLTITMTRLPRWASLTLFFLLGLATLASISLNQSEMAYRKHAFAAFSGDTVTVILIAFLVPSGWLGATIICLFALDVVLLYYFAWPASARSLISPLEPWLTLLADATALGVLRVRRELVTITRRTAEVQVERDWRLYTAQVTMAIRDLMNTPLQSLATAAVLLERRSPEFAPAARTIRSEVTEYGKLAQAFDTFHQFVNEDKSSTGFDALPEIQKAVKTAQQDLPIGLPANSATELGKEIKHISPTREAYHAALWFSWITAAFGLFGIILSQSTVYSGWVWYPTTALGMTSIAILLRQPRLPRTGSVGLISIQVVSAILGFSLAAALRAKSEQSFSPFSGIQILIMVLFMVAPSWRAGATLIGLTTLVPVLQFLSWTTEVRGRVPQQEPWNTVSVGIIALVGLYFRSRQLNKLKEDARRIEREAWLDRFAQLSLSHRHRSQSFLGPMRAELNWVRARCKEDDRLIRNMMISVKQLEELDLELSRLSGGGDPKAAA